MNLIDKLQRVGAVMVLGAASLTSLAGCTAEQEGDAVLSVLGASANTPQSAAMFSTMRDLRVAARQNPNRVPNDYNNEVNPSHQQRTPYPNLARMTEKAVADDGVGIYLWIDKNNNGKLETEIDSFYSGTEYRPRDTMFIIGILPANKARSFIVRDANNKVINRFSPKTYDGSLGTSYLAGLNELPIQLISRELDNPRGVNSFYLDFEEEGRNAPVARFPFFVDFGGNR